jgi:hypothetical protein
MAPTKRPMMPDVMDCNGNDDAPDDNLKERPTDLETPKQE